MKASQLMFVAQRKAELRDVDLSDAPGWGECRLRITHSLISPGTELSMYREVRSAAFAPGYTAAGIIEKGGPGFDPALVGQSVFCFPMLADSVACHASHKIVAAGALLPVIPAGMDAGKACFARMINVAMTPFCHLDPKITGSALIVGLGLVGNLAGQIAALRGFRVIGLDPDAARRRRAQDVGIAEVIDPSAGNPVEQVKALTGGVGTMLTINATGLTSTFPSALEATASGGELSTLGGARGTCDVDLSVILRQVQFRHVTLRGGWEMVLPRSSSPADHTPSTESNLRQALEWLRTDKIRLGSLWTHTIRPTELPAAYSALDSADAAYLGVVADWR
jgi:threonine dehydrogenase-like Zn-dependent dehydrogenase